MGGAPQVLPPEPAFPSHGSTGEVAERGMTLRDYFAAKALASLLANNTMLAAADEAAADQPAMLGLLSKAAYAMADAMLKARAS